MISNPFKHPVEKGHLNDVMRDKHYDYFGIDEYLNGNSECHLINENEIYKVIRNKQEVDAHAGHHHKVDLSKS